MQLKGIKDFEIDRNAWNKILISVYGRSELAIVEEIQSRLKKENHEAKRLKASLRRNGNCTNRRF